MSRGPQGKAQGVSRGWGGKGQGQGWEDGEDGETVRPDVETRGSGQSWKRGCQSHPGGSKVPVTRVLQYHCPPPLSRASLALWPGVAPPSRQAWTCPVDRLGVHGHLSKEAGGVTVHTRTAAGGVTEFRV